MKNSLKIVRRFYEALRRGDLPEVLGLLDLHIEWTEAERFPYYGGTWRSPEAIAKGLLEPLAQDWNHFEAKPTDFISEGDETVAFGIYFGAHKSTGRSVIAPFAHRWKVRDGKIIRFVQYTDTAKVLEAVGD